MTCRALYNKTNKYKNLTFLVNSGGRFFPAKITPLEGVPSHLLDCFKKISTAHVIVEWIGEQRFTAVKSSRTQPLGKTDVDQRLAGRSEEVLRRYNLALNLLNQ